MTTLKPKYRIVVHGQPAPQGSKTAGLNRKTGRAVLFESASKTLKPWREAVKYAALNQRIGKPPINGPVMVRMVFTVRKPTSAPKTRPTFPTSPPDLSKYARATEDALTDAGIWVDDARIIEYSRLAKVFPREDPESLDTPGAIIEVYEL